MKNLRKMKILLFAFILAFIGVFMLENTRVNAAWDFPDSTEYHVYMDAYNVEEGTLYHQWDIAEDYTHDICEGYCSETYTIVVPQGGYVYLFIGTDDGWFDTTGGTVNVRGESDGIDLTEGFSGTYEIEVYVGTHNITLVDYGPNGEYVLSLKLIVEEMDDSTSDPLGDAYIQLDGETYIVEETTSINVTLYTNPEGYVEVYYFADDGMIEGQNADEEYVCWGIDSQYIELGAGSYSAYVVDYLILNGTFSKQVVLTVNITVIFPWVDLDGNIISLTSSHTYMGHSATINLSAGVTAESFDGNQSYSGSSVTVGKGAWTICNAYSVCNSLFVGLPTVMIDLTDIYFIENGSTLTFDHNIQLTNLYHEIMEDVFILPDVHICTDSSCSNTTQLSSYDYWTAVDNAEVATTLTSGTYSVILDWGFEDNVNGSLHYAGMFRCTIVIDSTSITVNGTTYTSSETVTVIGSSATITVDEGTVSATDFAGNASYSGSSITLGKGIWNVSSGSVNLSVYVYQAMLSIGNELYFFDDGDSITLPAGTDVKALEWPLYLEDQITYLPDGVISADGEEAAYLSEICYTYVDYESSVGFVLQEGVDYSITVQWGITGPNLIQYMGTSVLTIQTTAAITGVISKATMSNGKITFEKTSDNNSLQNAYINANGTVTYFIGKPGVYDSDLDAAFEKYGVTVSASEFFSNSLVTPQGLVGNVELYTRLSASGLSTIFPRSGTIKIANSGSSTTSFALTVEETETQLNETLVTPVILGSSLLNYSSLNNNYSTIMFMLMIIISSLLSVEVIVIKKNKNKKAHN